MPFSQLVKQKALLWSDRHCCLCDTECGTDIEIAHIERGNDDLDNAIPLCYYCHATIGRYNDEHPRGNKFRSSELKARREQIYERYTRHLVPPTNFVITQIIGNDPNRLRDLPNVGFNISHLGDYPPVHAKISARVYLGMQDLDLVQAGGYYSGETIWNLNPRLTFYGNFNIPLECVNSTERLEIEVNVTIIDPYEREHDLLPLCFRHVRDRNRWYLDPTSFEQLRSHI
ncbi:MAG: hypothetical protein ACW98W_12620 [Candidatus Hodarchaeales archaeon]|jgi:hypothetical protein